MAGLVPAIFVGSGHSLYAVSSSKRTSTVPSVTCAPSVAISAIIPSCGAAIACSIFMASSTSERLALVARCRRLRRAHQLDQPRHRRSQVAGMCRLALGSRRAGRASRNCRRRAAIEHRDVAGPRARQGSMSVARVELSAASAAIRSDRPAASRERRSPRARRKQPRLRAISGWKCA